jgi:hypothetical protein
MLVDPHDDTARTTKLDTSMLPSISRTPEVVHRSVVVMDEVRRERPNWACPICTPRLWTRTASRSSAEFERDGYTSAI